jgi:hypothetical protein
MLLYGIAVGAYSVFTLTQVRTKCFNYANVSMAWIFLEITTLVSFYISLGAIAWYHVIEDKRR